MVQIKEIPHLSDFLSDKIKEIYTSSFPPDERRNWDDLLQICRTNPLHTFNLILKNEKEVGLLIFWKFDQFVYLEHFAIDDRFRGKGIGKTAMKMWIERQTLPVVLEVEPPAHNDQQRRISFYKQFGFRLWSVEYLQPPYSTDKQAVRLQLMNRGDFDVANRISEIKRVLHKEVYGLNLE